MFFRNIFLPIFLASTAMAFEKELSLDQVLNEAVRNSPRIKKSEAVVRENKWKRVETYSGFLPSLSANGNYLTNKKYLLTDIQLPGSTQALSIPQIIPTTVYSLNAQWLLFDGFASTDRLMASLASEKSAEKESSWTQFQVEREATLLFYKTLAAKVLKDVAEQNLKTLEDHLKDVTLFKRAGVSTNFDVLRVEVQVSEAKSEIMNTTDNLEISKGKLAETLGRDETLDVKGGLPTLDPDIVDKIDSTKIQRDDMLAIEERVRAIDYQDSAASRYWVPKVALFGNYQYYNNRNDEFSNWEQFRDGYAVGITLTWNLFDGMASIAKSNQVEEQHYQAEKNLQIARLRAKQDLDYWKRKYTYFCNVYRFRLSDIDKSSESVRLAREGRKVGSRTNTDLLDAEAELFRAKAGAVNAQVGAIEALLNLELATGKKLYHFR